MNKFQAIICGLAATFSFDAHSQSMAAEVAAHWVSYIVVSSSMPHRQVVDLARDAARSKSVMVLNGFVGTQNSLPEVQKYIGEINAECCSTQRPSRWVIDPKLVTRYGVSAAPTFILARGESFHPADWSKVAGDLDLASALKIFAQRSNSAGIRQEAANLYTFSFATP